MKTKLYEGMYLFTPTLSEESRNKALEKVLHGITEKGGSIEKIHDMGRKKLAYSIRGKKEGYYYLIYFSVSPAAIEELWKEYNLHEDLIRFMTLETEKVRESLEFKSLKATT